MSFEGMDVDQLQGLAKQIDSDAQAVDSLVTTLTGVIGTLTLLWSGPVAVAFEQDWQSKNRPALLSAYNTLRDLHTHLVSNISQQTSASAAAGGWTAERVVGDFENVLNGAGLVDMTKILAGTPIGTVLDRVGLVGMAIGAYQTGHEFFDVGEELAQDHYAAAANDFTEGVADGLQTYPSPVTFLAGTGLKLADQVVNQELQGTPAPVSGSNFPQNYVPSLTADFHSRAALEQTAKVLWGDS